jgi:hypothetical protein
MPGKLFIPQFDVDRWLSSGLAELKGDVLVARNGSFELRLRSASLFLRVVGDATDHRKLVGKVKDEDALATLGAEAYMTSVLFDDAAYDVEAGFSAAPIGAGSHDDVGVQRALRAIAT